MILGLAYAKHILSTIQLFDILFLRYSICLLIVSQ